MKREKGGRKEMNEEMGERYRREKEGSLILRPL